MYCKLHDIGESDDLDRRLQQHKYDIRKHNRNNPIVKHISDQDDPVNINNATTVKIINNVTTNSNRIVFNKKCSKYECLPMQH